MSWVMPAGRLELPDDRDQASHACSAAHTRTGNQKDLLISFHSISVDARRSCHSECCRGGASAAINAAPSTMTHIVMHTCRPGAFADLSQPTRLKRLVQW